MTAPRLASPPADAALPELVPSEDVPSEDVPSDAVPADGVLPELAQLGAPVRMLTDERRATAVMEPTLCLSHEAWADRWHVGECDAVIGARPLGPRAPRPIATLNPRALCRHCAGDLAALVGVWADAPTLSGPAILAALATPTGRNANPAGERATALMNSVATHFQHRLYEGPYSVLAPTALEFGLIAAPLAGWVRSWVGASNYLFLSGPVLVSDTPPVIETAIQLWELDADSPFYSLKVCLEAARGLCR